jgi:two-component system, cell cycle sensor histidine kinase and response regulator CckA
MLPGDIYARFFENAHTGLLLLEKETGRILEVNAAFLRMAGRSRGEVTGRSFWKPPLIADAEAGAEIHGHLLAGGAVAGAELPLQSGDGRWLLLEVSGGTVAGLIHVEVRNASGDEQARLAERFETLRLLARHAAAEFHNLHRSLLSMGDSLLVGAGQGRPVFRELEEIQRASERASAIAERLLAFSGELSLQIRPVALNDLVESLLPRLRQLFGRDIEIIPELSQDVALIKADPLRLRQIILNLAENSRDAMGRSGTFCLRTGIAQDGEGGLGATGAAEGPYGVLAVSDNGPGLDDESWAHLCEPFFTTKPAGLGMGLGLAAVYGIVRQNGGRLWAYSQPGKGTAFRIYLPLAGTPFPAPLAPDRSRCNATILLVEAHDGMRTVIANLLKKRGYRVLAALHSKEALRVAEAQGPPDLLISRPEPQLAMHLSRIQPQLLVLYLAGHTDGPVAEDHALPSRTFTLRKPFEPETLLATVSELLSQSL